MNKRQKIKRIINYIEWPCKYCGQRFIGENKDICVLKGWHCNRSNKFLRFKSKK